MASTVCASLMNSGLCKKMSSFLFVRAWAMRIYYIYHVTSISGLDSRYHFRLNISCGVAVKVRSLQKNFR